MTEFETLVQFVRQRFPEHAYLLTPGREIAVDGRIFRAQTPDGMFFKDENGESPITLAEAQAILEEDLQQE